MPNTTFKNIEVDETRFLIDLAVFNKFNAGIQNELFQMWVLAAEKMSKESFETIEEIYENVCLLDAPEIEMKYFIANDLIEHFASRLRSMTAQ